MAIVWWQPDGEYAIAYAGEAGPVIERVEVARDAGSEQVAEAIVAWLRVHDCAQEPVLLALPSTACLVGRLPLERPAAGRDRTRLAFALEEQLPLAAEESAMGFSVGGRQALGVATASAGIEPFIAALLAQGLVVAAVVPTALLGLQHRLAQDMPVPADGCHGLLCQTDHGLEWFVMAAGKPIDWRHFPASDDATGLIRELEFRQLSDPPLVTVQAWGLPDKVLDDIGARTGLAIQPASPLDAASWALGVAAAGLELLRGRLEPWVDLRTGALAPADRWSPVRPQLRVLAAAAAILLLVTSAALAWRAQQWQRERDRLIDAQAAVFAEVFPQQSLPVGVRSRLESEVAKLAGLTGQTAELPSHPPTLALLGELLAALPTELRLRIWELRFDEGRLYLDGEVRTHGDAEAVAAALRARGFVLEPPRTEQLPSEGVAMRITGAVQAAHVAGDGGRRR